MLGAFICVLIIGAIISGINWLIDVMMGAIDFSHLGKYRGGTTLFLNFVFAVLLWPLYLLFKYIQGMVKGY